MFVTVNRVYVRESYMSEVQKLLMSFVGVIPSDTTKFHPFVARSALNC